MMSTRLIALGIGGVLVGTLLNVTDAPTPASAAPGDATITVTIEAVRALNSFDTLDGADFYPDVDIAGTSHGGASLEITDDDDIQPNWTFSAVVPFNASAPTASIRVTMWDADGAFNGPRDQADLTAGDSDRDFNITVDLLACAAKVPDKGVSGDAVTACGSGFVTSGDSSPRASMRYGITVDIPDSDGDGLYDAWEINGYDADGNGLVDVNLPAMGARWDHKDLFLELDVTSASTLDREDIYAMKLAFAAAPIDAGTKASEIPRGIDAKPNPDGQRGITLHVDTGLIVDATAREGQALGTCNDGIDNGASGATDAGDGDCVGGGEYLDASIEDPGVPDCTDNADNDGDGLADENDSDCLLGENLGGGGVITTPSPAACNLDAAYYAAKANAFNLARSGIFRWALSLALDPSCPSSGGWGEIGGNDFMEFNFDGGTVMHELGHTLNLDHGGFESSNCKPNYVSGMNYDNQFGIRRATGGAILDYGPARLSLDGSSRGSVPGPINEAALDENTVLDAGDTVNQFVYTDSSGSKRTSALSVQPDYNNDTDPPFDSGFAGNVDTADTAGNPADCANASSASNLVSQNDWLRVSLPFRQFGDAADGPINPVTEPEMTLDELVALEDAISATDLTVTKTGPTVDVAAGTNATYTITVANAGPNVAPGVTLTDTVPAGSTYVSDTSGCALQTPTTLLCELGTIPAGASVATGVTLAVDADLVFDNGSPLDIVNSATATSARGSDPTPANNTANAATHVVAVADLGVTASVTAPPTEIIIGEPVTVTVGSTTTNAGPSSPMDVRLRTDVTASAGASATPVSQTALLEAGAVGTPQDASADVTLECAAPGEHTFDITTSVQPDRMDDSDPNALNDSATVQVTVDCVVPVAINIKPGGSPNSVNRNSSSDVPVAVLTTKAGEYGLPLDFNATTVIAESVRFGPIDALTAGGGSAETHRKKHLERSYELDERTRDADLDAVLHFNPSKAGLLATTVEGCVKGKFEGPSGQIWTFLGCDAIRIVK